jgi:uncharacterized protein YrrD
VLKRATELIGKTVVSADNGEKLGSVADLLLDDTDHRLVGLVINHGMLRAEQVLPAASIHTYGRDAVMARSGADLIDRKTWRASQGQAAAELGEELP